MTNKIWQRNHNIKMNKLPKMYSSYGNRRRHIFHQQQITTVICHLGLETYHRIKRILNSFDLGRCRHQHKRTKKNLVEKIKIMEIFCHQLLVTLFIYCVIKLYYEMTKPTVKCDEIQNVNWLFGICIPSFRVA